MSNFDFTQCNCLQDIQALEKNLSGLRAEYSAAQENSLAAIAKWFKAWRHTEAAKSVREITKNFTIVYAAATKENKGYENGILCSRFGCVWSPATLTTPAKWANAIEWARKVAEGRYCRPSTSDACKLTKSEAVERAAKCVQQCMNTDNEDRALTIWFNCKRGCYDGLIELEVELNKVTTE